MRARGFTLLEVVAALAVMGLLMVLLRQSVVLGLGGLSTYDRFARRHADVAPAATALRRVIGRMDPGTYTEPPTPKGTAALFTFVSELPVTGGLPPLRAEVAVGLRGDALVLRWTPDPHVERFGPAPPPHEEVLARGVARVAWRYAARGAGAAWEDGWTREALPGLVRLDVTFRDPGMRWPPVIVAPLREQPEE